MADSSGLLKLAWAICLSLSLWPFFIIVTILNEIVRTFVALLLLCSKCKLIWRGADGFFYSDKGFHTNTVLLAMFSPDPVDLDKERKLWMERVLDKRHEGRLTYKKLKHTLCTRFGYGCWRDDRDSFDIKDHVLEYDYTKPKDPEGYFTEAELTGTIMPLLSEPITHSERPQWEWLIIPKLKDAEGNVKSVRILRYHHAYMDGVFLGLLLGECLFDEWGKEGERPPFILDPKTYLNENCKVKRALLFARILTAIMAPLIVFKGAFSKPPGCSSDPFLTKKTSGKRYYMYSEPVSTWLIKKVAETEGKNSAVVCASLFQQSFRKMLARRGGNSKDAVIQMNVTQIIPPLTCSRPRNKFTVVGTQFASDSEWVDICMGPDILFAYMYIRWAGRMPRCLLRLMPKAGPSSVTFTNSPFLKKEAKLGGNRIDGMVGWTIIVKPMGIGLTTVGYKDQIRFTIAAEDGCLSEDEARVFLDDLRETLHDWAKDSNENIGIDKNGEVIEV